MKWKIVINCISLWLVSFHFLVALELDRVILSSDSNHKYIHFWPLVARAWQRLGIKPTLIFIDDGSSLQLDETCGDVIRFPALPGIPTSFQAQVIRLFAPALFSNDVCIVSDIDMFPLSKTFFKDQIRSYNRDCFIVYRAAAYGENAHRYPMCYVAALGRNFGEIFCIRNFSDITQVIRRWYNKKLGYSTDELMLYQYLKAWRHFKNKCVLLANQEVQRIDRTKWNYSDTLLAQDFYVDAHLLRPYSKYKKQIDSLARKLGILS
ncbi:MAG: hypothetical protein WA432_04510 [Candidatus Babeliaceae bacterium]